MTMLDAFDDAASAPPRRPRKRRWRRVVAGVVALLVALGVGTVAAYLAFLNHTVTSNVRREALLPTPARGLEPAPTREPAAKGAQNILVIGSDSLTAGDRGRSDVIVLVHISSDRSKVYLVHFPRDLYVSIPGRGRDKINAAYAYGGSPLLVRTLEGLVDVPIDHVGIIGFEGFKAMTDAVGGVDVFAEEASTGIHKGVNHLDGEQALTFVRERHQLSEGDISRGRRQQAFIKALLLKGLSREVLLNPVRLAKFLDAGTRNLTVDTDFSVADMRSQAFAMRALRGGDILFVTAPFAGYGTGPGGASIDIMDEAGMRELSTALSQDSMAGYAVGRQIP